MSLIKTKIMDRINSIIEKASIVDLYEFQKKVSQINNPIIKARVEKKLSEKVSTITFDEAIKMLEDENNTKVEVKLESSNILKDAGNNFSGYLYDELKKRSRTRHCIRSTVTSHESIGKVLHTVNKKRKYEQ